MIQYYLFSRSSSSPFELYEAIFHTRKIRNKRNLLNIPLYLISNDPRITSLDSTLRKFRILFCFIYIYIKRKISCFQANTTNQHRNGFHLVAKHVTSFPHSTYTIILHPPSNGFNKGDVAADEIGAKDG